MAHEPFPKVDGSFDVSDVNVFDQVREHFCMGSVCDTVTSMVRR